MKNKIFILVSLVAVVVLGFAIYLLNNGKCMVKFDTDGGNKIEMQILKKGDTVEIPDNPKKDGYVFMEWQLDGKKYDFNNKVDENITLTAKWMPEIYVKVTFDTAGGSEISTLEILSGLKINENDIESPVKDGYTFVGWYIGDKEYDFNKKVTTNITLTAEWVEGENVVLETESENIDEEKDNSDEEKNEKEVSKNNDDTNISITESSDFKVGDKVVIIGKYANSSDSTSSYYDTAIGWTREIIAIYEGSEYPYQVGDSTGTTGFFKKDALRID